MPNNNASVTLESLPSPPPYKSGWPWTEKSVELPELRQDKAKWPKISIVTPSYNQGQFIEETIRSVLLQGYPNLEYIVIDGGSTDNSVGIIEKYAPWLDYWISEKDAGQSDALNKGFALSTGEICAYINSDDMFLQSAFFTLASKFISHQNLKWVGSSVLCGEKLENARLWKAYAAQFPYFVVNQTIAQPGVFWSADIQPQPWFDISLHINMDHTFFIKNYLTIGLPLVLSEATAFFRTHPNSKTYSKSNDWHYEYDNLISKVIEQVDENTAFAIQQEAIRLKFAERLTSLLSSHPKTFSQKWVNFLEACQILTKTPLVFRDRIFISSLTSLFMKLFEFD